MVDYVIMPKQDYEEACDAIRAKTGKTDLIVSGAMADEISEIQTGGGESILPVVVARTISTIEASDLAGVTKIGTYAFAYCGNLTKVTIPTGVTSIEAYAFYHPTYLTEVNLPEGLLTIGESAFEPASGQGRIKSLTLPSTLTSIGARAFFEQVDITNALVIPDGVTEIGDDAFKGLYKNTSLTLGENLVTIGARAFSGWNALKSLSIPNSVTIIGAYAFASCSSNTGINIPENVVTLGGSAFSNNTAVKSINYNATNVTNSLSTSNRVFSKVGASTECKVTIGANVQTIPANLFNVNSTSASYQTNITSVKFAEGSVCSSIGTNAFAYMLKCEVFDFSTLSAIPTLGSTVFYQIPSTTKIIVPDELYDEWIAATNWTAYASNIVKASEVTE